MQDPYDDDDGYDDDQYDYDNNDQYDPYKFYFKFDVQSNSSLSDWLTNLFKDIGYNIQNVSGFPMFSFPVNSWSPNTVNDQKFQYLGSNYHSAAIWKSKYFIKDEIDLIYRKHIQSHAVYFIQQPTYYRGLYDILN